MTWPIVIVPTYNERDNLSLMVNALLQTPDLKILIVDVGRRMGQALSRMRLSAAPVAAFPCSTGSERAVWASLMWTALCAADGCDGPPSDRVQWVRVSGRDGVGSHSRRLPDR